MELDNALYQEKKQRSCGYTHTHTQGPAVTHDVPKEMWPPSSPDLNLLNYWAQGYFEERPNRSADSTKNSLIATIKENLISLYMYMVTRDRGRFRRRVGAVIEAGGDFII